MATIGHDIQFIHSHEKSTLGAQSAEAQRRVHSHAARAAHAKTRRQRVIQYQATKAIRNDFNGKQPPSRAADEVQVSVISGPIAPLGCGRRDPFASFARRLSPTEDFLLDYYAHNVVPCSTFEYNQSRLPGASARNISKQFVQLAATSISGLNGLFLVTCRHLSYCLPQQGAHYVQLALQYKVDCAQILMQAICTLETQSPISDSIITVAVFLAQDEILLGNIPWVQRHLQGAIQMVKHNGALKEKGHNVFLYDIIRNDIANSEIIRVVTRAKTAAQPVPALPLGRRKRSNGGSVVPLRDPIQIAGPRFTHYHGGAQTVSRYA
ncbi:hypothetical protein K456DRAFT_39204 [Colletotrichum gloeosporioides 23]|nr:hypothetical protein K456DRAFT_39204 [Colletotrichum gloeosporioides 23]